MEKHLLLNNDLPVVTEYNDLYDKSDLAEVVAKAEEDDLVALYELGSRYRCGEGGVDKDFVKAAEYLKKVLQFQRNANAMYNMGYMCVCGDLGEDEIKDSIGYFEAAMELGDARAALQLGIIYEAGEIVPQNYDKALELYQFALDKGMTIAYSYVADIYRHMDKHNKAIEYYNIAIENGDMLAALPLGRYYEVGIGVEKDDKRAFELYKLAYEDGNPDSTYYLARMYYLGWGTEEDDAKAFELFKEASDNGDIKANCDLGTMYGYGVEGVVEKNVNLAMEYLSNVTESQQARACYIKGCICANEHIMEEAVIWHTKAADLGNEEAVKILPNVMMQFSSDLLSNGGDGFTKAVKIMEEANRKFPDNLAVKHKYAIIMHMDGHICRKIGANDDAYVLMKNSLEAIDLLKRHNYEPDVVRKTEIDVCMELAELSIDRNENDSIILGLLQRTDINKYPYASVLKSLTHYDNLRDYRQCIPNDLSELHSVLGSSKWRSETEEAGAYFVLSLIYANGISGKTDVPYAYECIQKCASLDADMAKDEIKKYSKGIFGKITYKN